MRQDGKRAAPVVLGPGAREWIGRSRAGRGMTLIEISIGLLIVGLMMVAVVPSLRAVTGADLRKSVQQLAGAIRYMYGRSALSGNTCRIVMDLGAEGDEEDEGPHGEWWAECAEGKVTLARDAREEEEEKPQDEVSEEERVRQQILRKAQFSSFTSRDIERVRLSGLGFESVWVSHLRDKVESGRAYLYFFPMGYTEDAVIALSDGDDVYSIKVRGLSGRVTVVKGPVEVPRS